MTLIIATPRYETVRNKDGLYSIHNVETGRTTRLDHRDSTELNMALLETPGRRFDDVLSLWES
jgi:hypothetical protein